MITAEQEYRGVKGWLFLFCFNLIAFRPIYALLTMVQAWDKAEKILFSRSPGLKTLFTVIYSGEMILLAWGFLIGMTLFISRRDHVPHLAKIYLASLILFSLISIAIPYLFDFPTHIHSILIDSFAKGAIQTLLGAGIWLLYLHNSTRVSMTYDQKKSHQETVQVVRHKGIEPQNPEATKKRRWFFIKGAIIIAVIIALPFGIPVIEKVIEHHQQLKKVETQIKNVMEKLGKLDEQSLIGFIRTQNFYSEKPCLFLRVIRVETGKVYGQYFTITDYSKYPSYEETYLAKLFYEDHKDSLPFTQIEPEKLLENVARPPIRNESPKERKERSDRTGLAFDGHQDTFLVTSVTNLLERNLGLGVSSIYTGTVGTVALKLVNYSEPLTLMEIKQVKGDLLWQQPDLPCPLLTCIKSQEDHFSIRLEAEKFNKSKRYETILVLTDSKQQQYQCRFSLKYNDVIIEKAKPIR